jgi:hypothetical protein
VNKKLSEFAREVQKFSMNVIGPGSYTFGPFTTYVLRVAYGANEKKLYA